MPEPVPKSVDAEEVDRSSREDSVALVAEESTAPGDLEGNGEVSSESSLARANVTKGHRTYRLAAAEREGRPLP